MTSSHLRLRLLPQVSLVTNNLFVLFLSLSCIIPESNSADTTTTTQRNRKTEVLCSGNLRCNPAAPICCSVDEGYGDHPYCVPGGYTCCDAGNGLNLGSCPVGTTCCVGGGTNGTSRVKSCCRTETQVCTASGQCITDECTQYNDPVDCTLTSGCRWCCNNKCMSESDYQTGCSTDPAECDLGCAGLRTCSKCLAGPACTWCCSTGTCTHTSVSKCSYFSSIPDTSLSLNCSMCDRKGSGLIVITEEEQPLGVTLLTLTIYVITVVIFLCLCFFFARILRKALKKRPNAYGDTPPPDIFVVNGAEFTTTQTDSELNSSRLQFVRKLRFYDLTEPLPCDVPEQLMQATDAEGVPQCVICLESEPQVLFVPCGHVCCCCRCALHWDSQGGQYNTTTTQQQTHHAHSDSQQHHSSGASGNATYIRCPICRERLDIMIRLK
eukprot:PhF_6_TR25639/c0_g2_i2/m.36057